MHPYIATHFGGQTFNVKYVTIRHARTVIPLIPRWGAVS